MDRPEPNAVRLQKFLADAGVCSRRAAEGLIEAGEVWVNAKKAVIGQKIVPGADKVTVSGEPVKVRRRPEVTLAVNKPRGVVCAEKDPHGAESIFGMVPPPYARLRFLCAGRLEKESEGLVILTTDGDIANRLTHPSGLVTRHYRVSLAAPLASTDVPRLLKGVVFEDERIQVDRARLVGRATVVGSTEVDVETHRGRKRDVRQIFTALGCGVKRLRCYQIGRFSLRGFPLRGVKPLTDSEIALLLSVPAVPTR